MRRSYWFLAIFFAACILILASKSPGLWLTPPPATLQVVTEANMTQEEFFGYLVAIGGASIFCFVMWIYNFLFEREEIFRKNKFKGGRECSK